MDLNKIAQDEHMTYLQKVAAIVDEFAAGNISGEDADTVAQEAGIAPEDLLSIHTAAYGDIEKVAKEEADLEKEASDEAFSMLIKIAEDAESTYLTKCAGIADAFAVGAMSGEDADTLASEMGLSPSDVASVFDAAYGDELEKEAGVSGNGTRAAIKDGVNAATTAVKRAFTKKEKLAKGVSSTSNNQIDNARKAVAKVAGGTAAVGGAGYGASKMFGGKDDE